MSQDDGTYILQTYGPEYRIVYAHAIDNIYGSYNPENNLWIPNVNGIVDYFGSSNVYASIEDAWDAAFNLDETKGYSELGTCLISDFSQYEFADFVKKYVKEN